MSIIDKTYFRGNLNIPGTDNQAIGQRVDWFIETYEKELLQDLFGYAMYSVFSDPANATEQRWIDLIEGAEYIVDGTTFKWEGLKRMVACYVYFQWLQDKANVLTTAGVVTPTIENAAATDSTNLQVKTWNQMSDIIMQMYYFLRAKIDVYPELEGPGYYFTPYYWWPSYNHFSKYSRINPYGI